MRWLTHYKCKFATIAINITIIMNDLVNFLAIFQGVVAIISLTQCPYNMMQMIAPQAIGCGILHM